MCGYWSPGMTTANAPPAPAMSMIQYGVSTSPLLWNQWVSQMTSRTRAARAASSESVSGSARTAGGDSEASLAMSSMATWAVLDEGVVLRGGLVGVARDVLA